MKKGFVSKAVYIPETFVPTWEKFMTICKRDRTENNQSSGSKHIRDFIEEYVRLHEPGNPQQRIDIISKLERPYRAHGCFDCGTKKVVVETRVNGVSVRLCEKDFRKRKNSLNGWKYLDEKTC